MLPGGHQRCWQHKSLNVLDKLPKPVQPNAHRDLREILLSENRAAAEAAMTIFAEKYAPRGSVRLSYRVNAGFVR